MKKGTILAMLLAAALAISPMGVFAADDVNAAEGVQDPQATVLDSGADQDQAGEEQADESEDLDLIDDSDEEEFDEEEPESFMLTAAAVTPGEWNSDRTQYRVNGTPISNSLFVAPKAGAAQGAGLYFADSSGYVLGSTSTYKGKVTPTSGPYYALKNGEWVETESSHSYYLNNASDPYMVEKAGAYGGSTKYFVASNGCIRTKEGVVTAENGDRYYVKSGGEVRTTAGFVKYSDYTYFVRDGGKIRLTEGTFRASTDGELHLITGSNGHVVTDKGFRKYDGDYYYISGKYGKIAADKTLTVKGKKYHVNTKGVVKVGLHTWEGAKYLANSKGALYTQGIHKYENKRYYVTNKYGKIAVKKRFTYKGSTYFASKDGHLLTGIILWYNNKYYYLYDSGKLMTKNSLFKYNGKWYNNKSGGGLSTNTFITRNYKHYYAGSKAYILTSNFKYSGHTVHPDRDDGEIPFKDWNAIHGNKWAYNKYVSISISGQSLTLYKNGEKVVSTSIISGSPGTSYATPKGTYKVRTKLRNQTAKYEGKSFNIEYYVGFSSDNAALAIGDGPYWVTSYGGSKYKLDGSMGQVLLPYYPAITVYNNVDTGTPVVIK